MRLVLWRHGQTVWNAEQRFQGQSDIPLDETGRAQADRAARLLAGLRPDLIVSSDLSRAASTAAALARLTGLEVTLDKDLRERHGGCWEGLTDTEIRGRYPAEHASWNPPDGEPSPVVAERVAGALHRVATALAETQALAERPASRVRRPGWPWWSATAPRSGWACRGCSVCRTSCSACSARCPTAPGRCSAAGATAGVCLSTTRVLCPSPFSATTVKS